MAHFSYVRAESIGQVSVRANGREMMRATRRSWDEFIRQWEAVDINVWARTDNRIAIKFIDHILRDQRDAMISVHHSYVE